MKTLLLGMGNPILCDDAVGVRLAAAVAQRLGRRPDVDVVAECGVGGLGLLDVLAGYERVLAFDSIQTGAGRPGDWYVFDAAALRDTVNLRNVHDTNLATALALGRSLGLCLPADRDIRIYAVEVEDNVTFSERMSAALEHAFPELVEQVWADVAACLGEAAPAAAPTG